MSNFEFDTAYSAITGECIAGEYVPTVEHDETADILRGAVLHPSETADDDTIREWVRDAGGDMFAIVAVEAPCTDEAPCFPDEPTHCAEQGCDAFPAGWAIHAITQR